MVRKAEAMAAAVTQREAAQLEREAAQQDAAGREALVSILGGPWVSQLEEEASQGEAAQRESGGGSYGSDGRWHGADGNGWVWVPRSHSKGIDHDDGS